MFKSCKHIIFFLEKLFQDIIKYLLVDVQKKIWTILSFVFGNNEEMLRLLLNGFHIIRFLINQKSSKIKTWPRTMILAGLIVLLTKIPEIYIMLEDVLFLREGWLGKSGKMKQNRQILCYEHWEVGKGLVKLINTVGENSSFIFRVCVKSVPHYHFKLAYIVLQIAVNEVFETHF